MNQPLAWCGVAAAACLSACRNGPLEEDYWPARAPLGREYEAVTAPRAPGDQAPSGIPNPTGDLTLTQALALTLQHNPALAGFAWEIRAEEARLIQAQLLPNPEFEVEIEDFGGSGPASGFDGSETTLAIGQTILLGGKIAKRTAVARHERDLAGWDYEAARVATFAQAAQNFITTLVAQRRLELARETTALAERIFATVSERVEAGQISPVERTKSELELARARLELRRAEADLQIARHRLAAGWGSDSPAFDRAVGELEQVQPPPQYADLLAQVENNPDLARWSSEMGLRRAQIELALAEAIPSLTLRGGVRLLEGGDEHAFVLGGSLPIPIFDRNQGGILEARIRRAQTDRLNEAAAVRVRTDLATAVHALSAAHDEVVAMQEQIMPGARSAFDAAEEAFRHGKIGAIDLLDAERTLFTSRSQYLEALADYHLAVIAVEQLIGSPLNVDVAEQAQDQPQTGDSP